MAKGDVLRRSAYIRLATVADVPVLKLLIEGLAQFEKLLDECQATESALESTIFRRPAFVGPTVFLLELGSSSSAPPPPSAPPLPPCPPRPPSSKGLRDETFQRICYEVNLPASLEDAKASTFVSSEDRSRTVIGYVLFYPSYSTNLAKPGLHIGDMYIREAYRRQGLGTLLLKTVAQRAAKNGYGRVEWFVLGWNEKAIKFYESMGAVVQQDWKICRLDGDALQAYGD